MPGNAKQQQRAQSRGKMETFSMPQPQTQLPDAAWGFLAPPAAFLPSLFIVAAD